MHNYDINLNSYQKYFMKSLHGSRLFYDIHTYIHACMHAGTQARTHTIATFGRQLCDL